MGRQIILIVEYTRPLEIYLRRIIDKETGPLLDHGYDLRAHIVGDRGTAVGRPHHSIFLQDAGAHIRGAVNDDIPAAGHVIEASVHAVDTEGETVVAVVGFAGDIEAEAAFIRVAAVGERAGIFVARVHAVGDIGAVE